MNEEVNITALRAVVESRLLAHREKLASFKENLEANPVYAFEWGESALQSSVAISEYGELLHWLGHIDVQACAADRIEKFSDLKDRYSREAHNASTRISSSTAKMANLVEDHKRAIICTIAGWLNSRFACSLV